MIFDLDDTLINDTGAVDSCWSDALGELLSAPGIDAATARRRIDTTARLFWADAENFRVGRLDLRATTRRLVLDAIGDSIGERVAFAIADRYRDLREARTELFAGSIELLSSLQRSGIAMALLTNGAAGPQRLKIDRFELVPFFSFIAIEGEQGVGKPFPTAFRAVLDALGSSPSETWMVGDSFELDITGALEVGMDALWVTGSRARESTTTVRVASITSVAEISYATLA